MGLPSRSAGASQMLEFVTPPGVSSNFTDVSLIDWAMFPLIRPGATAELIAGPPRELIAINLHLRQVLRLRK